MFFSSVDEDEDWFSPIIAPFVIHILEHSGASKAPFFGEGTPKMFETDELFFCAQKIRKKNTFFPISLHSGRGILDPPPVEKKLSDCWESFDIVYCWVLLETFYKSQCTPLHCVSIFPTVKIVPVQTNSKF